MAQNKLLTLTIPCGKGGLNRMENYLDFPIEDAAWVDGITVERLSWEKEGGASHFNSTAMGATVLAGHDTFTGSGLTQEMVVWLNDGRLAVVASGGAITKTLASGLTTAVPGWFSEGVVDGTTRALFFTNGSDLPRVYTGGSTADEIEGPAIDWTGTNFPHFSFNHNFRTLMATKYSSILYLSNPKDHGQYTTDFPNTRTMDVYPGEQQYMAGGISWRDRAYLIKYERGVYYLDDSDVNVANWGIKKVTDSIGIAGPGSILGYDDDVILLGSDGYFYSLSDVTTLGQRSVTPILPTELGEFLRSEINLDRLDLVQSAYYGRKRQIWFALPAAGSTINNRRLVIDMNLKGKVRILWSERDECSFVGTYRNVKTQYPIWGDSTGYVWVGDQTARNKNSVGYTGQFETPPIDLFPAGERFGNLNTLQVIFKPTGAYDLSLEVHGDENLLQTVTASQQSSGSPSGSFSLDADVLAGTTVQTSEHRLYGEARRVKLLGKNAEVDETFAIQALAVKYTPGRHGAV